MIKLLQDDYLQAHELDVLRAALRWAENTAREKEPDIIKKRKKEPSNDLIRNALGMIKDTSYIVNEYFSASPSLHPPGVHPSRKLPRSSKGLPERPHPKSSHFYRRIYNDRSRMGLWRLPLPSILQTFCWNFPGAELKWMVRRYFSFCWFCSGNSVLESCHGIETVPRASAVGLDTPEIIQNCAGKELNLNMKSSRFKRNSMSFSCIK